MSRPSTKTNNEYLLHVFHQDMALQLLLKQLHSLFFSLNLRSVVHFLLAFLLSINRPLITAHFVLSFARSSCCRSCCCRRYLSPISLVVASFLTAFFASVKTSDQLLSQTLISSSWNNVLQDKPVEEEVGGPTELLVQLGNEWG